VLTESAEIKTLPVVVIRRTERIALELAPENKE
jgi:hypothetical protein